MPSTLFFLRIPERHVQTSLLVSAAVSLIAFYTCKRLIPIVGRYTLKVRRSRVCSAPTCHPSAAPTASPFAQAGLYGMDINKKGTEAGEKKVPESLGLAVGVVYLVCIALFQLLHFEASAWQRAGCRGSWQRTGAAFRRRSAGCLGRWLALPEGLRRRVAGRVQRRPRLGLLHAVPR